MNRLKDKVAIVTGGAVGIGRATAELFLEEGARVVVADMRTPECEALFVETDISNEDDCRHVCDEAVRAFGRLDILVNNAGIIRRAPALEFGEEDWEAVIKINVSAAFYLSQAAARHFVEENRGGKIINTASVLSYEGGIVVPSYSASKAGIANLTRALANEWAPLGINVNAIAPSYFTTELTSALREDVERSEALLARLPAGRFGEPEDLKGAAVLLASDAADYMHGATVPVDGGWLAR